MMDPVSRKLSLLIRPTLVPRDDNVFVWSDWSNIEARILPWLASPANPSFVDASGAMDRLALFRAADADLSIPDLYTRTTSEISGIPIAQITKALRQRGKVAELALGFGGGVSALQAMGAGYGLHLDDTEAKLIVERWRGANPWCVKFWGKHDDLNGSYGLWGALNRAIEQPGTTQVCGRIVYIYQASYLGGSLLCMLPSGRFLTYRDIRYERVPDLDDDDKIIGYSVRLRFARGYGERIKFWHGMACENVVQAVAADVLRGTLVRLEELGFPTRLHTHDEILGEVPANAAIDAAALLRDVMRSGFEWSHGLPLMSEETIAYYYTKSEKDHGL